MKKPSRKVKIKTFPARCFLMVGGMNPIPARSPGRTKANRVLQQNTGTQKEMEKLTARAKQKGPAPRGRRGNISETCEAMNQLWNFLHTTRYKSNSPDRPQPTVRPSSLSPSVLECTGEAMWKKKQPNKNLLAPFVAARGPFGGLID